jgi:RAP domain/FAST kinase-like protein, subdomain 1
MKRCKKLKPYQVAAKWNHLGKAVQRSLKLEQQSFWIDHEATLQTLLDQTIQSANRFDGRSTATVTHSLVKILHLTNSSKSLGEEFQPLWNTLLYRTIELIQSRNGLNAHDISNLVWAYANVAADGIKVNGRLLDALAKKALIGIADFNPQNLSNTAWSFATVNHEAQLLFDAIAQVAPVRINEFSPQALSNTAWAFATLNHEAPLLLDSIAGAAPGRINEFSAQSLANTAWAFATLNHEARLFLDAIARAAQARINEFNAQALANTAWAFAILNHNAPSLFDAIAGAAPVRIGEFTPQNLCNTAWAFATLNHKAPSLFEAIARAAQKRIQDFSPQDLSNTAWAFATLNHKAPSLFDAIAGAAPVRINDFNPQALSNTAWAFAVFNIEPDSFILDDSPFARKLLSTDPSLFLRHELCQLHQFQLWCIEQTGASWFPNELSQQCRQAFVSAEAAPSWLQNEVMESLRTTQGVSLVEVEVSTPSGYSLDAVVVFHGNRNNGVEVDGPFHFVGQSKSPNGATLLKRRQLSTLEGWKLITIPYWEWDAIDTGSHKERNEKRSISTYKRC